MPIVWLVGVLGGAGLILWGAELFTEHLAVAAVRLRISAFALALLLAGAEPEELATAVTASWREAPAIALGDVIGANIAICLVALGVGAVTAPLPFGKRVMPYALGGLSLGIIVTYIMWNGTVSRMQGVALVALYLLFIGVIWLWERQPPALGETAELEEAQGKPPSPLSRDLGLVLVGLALMVGGSLLLVEGVRQITHGEETQTKLSLAVVGFATAFELVVLAWSSAKRGAREVAVAGVVGSFAYNVTMTLGMAAIARPLQILDASLLHLPLLIMVSSLGIGIGLAVPKLVLDRRGGAILLSLYPLALIAIFLAR
jgi:cation:H+ antiporter